MVSWRLPRLVSSCRPIRRRLEFKGTLPRGSLIHLAKVKATVVIEGLVAMPEETEKASFLPGIRKLITQGLDGMDKVPTVANQVWAVRTTEILKGDKTSAVPHWGLIDDHVFRPVGKVVDRFGEVWRLDVLQGTCGEQDVGSLRLGGVGDEAEFITTA